MPHLDNLPVAIIGGGPVGLAAAANLAERDIPFRLYEAGIGIGANLLDWAHVRIFTSWEQSVDPVSVRLLTASGWHLPATTTPPTGGDLVRDYLVPLAALPMLRESIETKARVTAISRLGIDKVTSKGREAKPFRLRVETSAGEVRDDLARAVIDASGTWTQQNPLGGSGLTVPGEAEQAQHIAYGMPDVLGAAHSRYADKRIAVIGSGYSAINVLLDLARLPDTVLTWVIRGSNLARIYGGGKDDQLPARGALGWQLRQLVEQGRIRLISGFSTEAVIASGEGLVLKGETPEGALSLWPVDEIIGCTGQRPDLAMTRELRLEFDPWLESVRALGPLIDPNLHSCGSVPPHGHRELSHPEPGFHTIGVKSYGRAPTFLLLTGYEQARSVVAAIAGDMAAADDVQLVLPETGICNDDPAIGGGCCVPAAEVAPTNCCGGPVAVEEEACCVTDSVAKQAGKSGCGCGPAA
jgi:thioredoxin reductase